MKFKLNVKRIHLLNAMMSFMLGCIYAVSLYGQIEVFPDSKIIDFSKKEAFTAEYNQMGQDLKLVATISSDKKNYNITMIMPDISDPSRVITDVIGLDRMDGKFIYRNFHLLHPNRSFLQVEHNKSSLDLSSSSQEVKDQSLDVQKHNYYDGTFVYWMLSELPFESDRTYKINTWKYTPDGLKISLSPPFIFEGNEEVKANGVSYNCRKVSVEASPGNRMISYLSKSKPYLIKQEFQSGENDAVTILELTKTY